jgi:hypothetical protein
MGKLIIDSISVLDRPVIVAYLCIIVLHVHHHQPRRRPPLLGARSAGASVGRERLSMSDRDPTQRAARAPARRRSPRCETPFRRFVLGFRREPIAMAGLAVFAVILTVPRCSRR